MLARQRYSAGTRPASAIQSNSNPAGAPNRETIAFDPLSSKEIDAEIRWFFEHAIQQDLLSP